MKTERAHFWTDDFELLRCSPYERPVHRQAPILPGDSAPRMECCGALARNSAMWREVPVHIAADLERGSFPSGVVLCKGPQKKEDEGFSDEQLVAADEAGSVAAGWPLDLHTRAQRILFARATARLTESYLRFLQPEQRIYALAARAALGIHDPASRAATPADSVLAVSQIPKPAASVPPALALVVPIWSWRAFIQGAAVGALVSGAVGAMIVLLS